MKKIPTVFVRDQATKLVVDEVTPGCEWVLAGEGIATRKWDGTCCMVRDGRLFKRYDAKNGKTPPPNFVAAQEPDPITGHWPGWVPVGDGPADQYHREAWALASHGIATRDGTYELVGPKVNNNPEGFSRHLLVPHGYGQFSNAPRAFGQLAALLSEFNVEGIVFHHQDGRMAKIKRKDFGLKWP